MSSLRDRRESLTHVGFTGILYQSAVIQATWRSGHSWIELKRSHASSWNHADDGGALFRARHFTRHPASGTVLQKIGMTHEGHRGQHEKKWGIYEGEVLYGMLKDDLYL